jgi:hypothetical protein
MPNHTTTKRVELLTLLADVLPFTTTEFTYRGLDIKVTSEGLSRTVTFPDADTDFGVLTYGPRFDTVLNTARDLEWLAAAWAARNDEDQP